MGAFDSVVKRVQPQVSALKIVPADLNAAYVALGIGQVNAWNMRAGKLGSTDGSAYGTLSVFSVSMALTRWQNIWMGFHLGAAFNQNVTLRVYTAYTVSAVPLTDADIRGKLLEVVIPASSDYMRFSIGDGWGDVGGVVGGATVGADAHYRISPGLACPLLIVSLQASSAPSAGALDMIEIVRTT